MLLLLSATVLAVLVGISPWLLLGLALMGGLITLLQKQLLQGDGDSNYGGEPGLASA